MKNVKKLLALLLVACTMLGLLAACGGNDASTDDAAANNTQSADSAADGETQGSQNVVSEGPQYGGHLNVHTLYNTNNIDYLMSQGVWGYVWSNCVYESVLTRDADYNIAPGVCNYELSDDQLTLKLWVREGVTFHNGDTVDIYDIEASVNRFLANYSSAKTFVTPYVKSVVVDGDCLVLTFTEYHEKVMYYIANSRPWCAVIPKETCEKYPNGVFTAVEDSIATGPYKITGFTAGVKIELEKYDGYVPFDGGTGMAGPKYGYMDTITFWNNQDYSSSTMAMLSGEYDVSDVIEEDYRPMAESMGLVKHNLGDTCTGMYALFNTYGSNNVCAKYPELRKAIMAAIDYEEFIEIYSDGGTSMGGSPIILDTYDTDIFETADYYGDQDLDLAEQYLELARAAGYDDEPVQLLATTTAQDVEKLALLGSYLDAAGINYDKVTMESVAYQKFIATADNNWDFFISYPLLGYTPATMHDAIKLHYWKSEAKDALYAALDMLEPGSEEYLNKWYELAQLTIDECAVAYFGTTQWIWYHSDELVTNDPGAERYFYNAYWTNPAEHQK